MSYIGPIFGEPSPDQTNAANPPQQIVLALPGGGIRCAWQTGALKFLLERLNVKIVAISGTSGGAFNGAIISSSLSQNKSHMIAAEKLTSAWSTMQPYAVANRFMQMFLNDQTSGFVKYAVALTSRFTGHPLVHAFSPFIGQLREGGPALYINYTLPNGESRTRQWSGSIEEIAASAAHMDAFPAVTIPGEGACSDGIHAGPNACKSMLGQHVSNKTWLLRLDVWKDPELAAMDEEMALKKRALPEAQVAELMRAIPGLVYHRVQPTMVMPNNIFHGDNVTIDAMMRGGYADMERYFRLHAPHLIKARPVQSIFTACAAAATAMTQMWLQPFSSGHRHLAGSTAQHPQPVPL